MVRNQQLFVNDDDAINQNSVFDLYDCRIDVSKHDVVTGILFFLSDYLNMFLFRARNMALNLTSPSLTRFMIHHRKHGRPPVHRLTLRPDVFLSK